mmetsp:Transcript_36248/g.100627  ORF Transcript_36248/g.100627 Transcript_36248/m.100627 type:complete len:112 (-) Transcript_36248:135-470(-)
MAEAALAPEAATAQEEGDPESGKEKHTEESTSKLCFFACLDCLASVARGIVAAWNGIRWVARRVSYPIKEVIVACIDSWARWYQPYRAKRPQAPTVPWFTHGGQGVPDFQY